MKDFPKFETFMCPQNIKEEIEKYFDLKKIQKEQIAVGFGLNIVVDKTLPPNSALFIDHKKRIVAIYKDGKVVYSPRVDREKPLSSISDSLKKKRDRELDDAEEVS